jgi:hypothetical protein
MSTQWAAQFAVASELEKRGYRCSFSLGDCTRDYDLVVVAPSGQTFLIDTKGNRNEGSCWDFRRKPPLLNLFYVFVYVPANAQNRFFLLTQAEANERIHCEDTRPDIRLADVCKRENAWHILPL